MNEDTSSTLVTPWLVRLTLLLAAGEDPKVVQERLGHSSITLTLDTYTHVVPGVQERAASKLEDLITAEAHRNAVI